MSAERLSENWSEELEDDASRQDERPLDEPEPAVPFSPRPIGQIGDGTCRPSAKRNTRMSTSAATLEPRPQSRKR